MNEQTLVDALMTISAHVRTSKPLTLRFHANCSDSQLTVTLLLELSFGKMPGSLLTQSLRSKIKNQLKLPNYQSVVEGGLLLAPAALCSASNNQKEIP